MKILHASHTHMKTLGARNYLLPVRINNGFIRNNHEVFWFSDRDVARYSSFLGSRKTGVRACNRKFLEVCRNFEPDVIALCSADIISPDTLAVARRLLPNVAIFQYYIDALYIDDNVRDALAKADVVDRTFATTAGPILRQIAGSQSRVSYFPNPVDSSIDIHHCHERSDQAYDVFFAGHVSPWSDPDDLRSLAPGLLKEKIPEACCAFYGIGLGESLYGAACMRALGDARIGLNFSQKTKDARPGPGGGLYLYSSDRISLYLGNGLLVFSTRAFSLSDLYGDDAIVEVGNADEFIDRMRYYLENDEARRRVAQTGYELAHREFNERQVAQYMLEATLEMQTSHDYQWPQEIYRR
jgi:glycosyltransferase involved in cell wall biosynthesis